MSTARARSALQRGPAANVAPQEPASSSPATAGTRTSSRTRRAPLAFGETNARTASSSSSTVKSSTSKPNASGTTTSTSRAAAKRTLAVPPPVVEDKENDALPASRKRARPQPPQRQIRQPSIDSLAELEASYIDNSRVSTATIPADSSLVHMADAPAHSTPIASPALAPAPSLAAKGRQGRPTNKRVPFESLLDEEMLSETEVQLGSAKPSGSDDSEEAKTRRQLTENKLERVRSFVGSSGQHLGSSLAPPPIDDYKEALNERRSKTAGTSEEDQEDEFGFYTVLKKNAANRAEQSRGVVPGPSSERVHFNDRKGSAEQEESSSLPSLHPAQPASQTSSHAEQDSLQALLRSSPSDIARPADKEESTFSDDDSMDTDDYLYAPKVPRADSKKPRKKPRLPNPRKGPKVADAPEGSAAKVKGKGGAPSTSMAAASTGKKGSAAQARKKAVESKAGPKKKRAEQTLSSDAEEQEEQEQEEVRSTDGPLFSSPEVAAGAKRSRRSAQNSKSTPVPLTAAADKPLGASAAGNVADTERPKAKPLSKAAGKGKSKGKGKEPVATAGSTSKRKTAGGGKTGKGKRRQEEVAEDEDEDDPAGDDDDDSDEQEAPRKAKGREKRLKMYDELDDYALGEEWVI